MTPSVTSSCFQKTCGPTHSQDLNRVTPRSLGASSLFPESSKRPSRGNSLVACAPMDLAPVGRAHGHWTRSLSLLLRSQRVNVIFSGATQEGAVATCPHLCGLFWDPACGGVSFSTSLPPCPPPWAPTVNGVATTGPVDGLLSFSANCHGWLTTLAWLRSRPVAVNLFGNLSSTVETPLCPPGTAAEGCGPSSTTFFLRALRCVFWRRVGPLPAAHHSDMPPLFFMGSIYVEGWACGQVDRRAYGGSGSVLSSCWHRVGRKGLVGLMAARDQDRRIHAGACEFLPLNFCSPVST
jgi:hypothetical protein